MTDISPGFIVQSQHVKPKSQINWIKPITELFHELLYSSRLLDSAQGNIASV